MDTITPILLIDGFELYLNKSGVLMKGFQRVPVGLLDEGRKGGEVAPFVDNVVASLFIPEDLMQTMINALTSSLASLRHGQEEE